MRPGWCRVERRRNDGVHVHPGRFAGRGRFLPHGPIPQRPGATFARRARLGSRARECSFPSREGGLMLRNSFWIAALGLTLALPAASAQAQDYLERGTWELTLSGSGASNEDLDAGSAGIGASLGYFLTDGLEILGRQTVA